MNICITTSENQNNSSTLAQQQGSNVILVSYMVIFNNYYPTYQANQQSTGSTVGGLERVEIYIAQITSMADYSGTVTYADTGIENSLLETKIFHQYQNDFAVVLPSEKTSEWDIDSVLFYIADVLRKHDHNVEVVTSRSPNCGYTAG